MTGMMGVFWSIQMWSVVVGGVLNIVVFAYAPFSVYMFIILALAAVSIFLPFILLHPYRVHTSK